VPLPYVPRGRVATLLRMFTGAAVIACTDTSTGPRTPADHAPGADSSARPAPIEPLHPGGNILVEHARILDRDRATLLSSAEDLARGRFRFRVLDRQLPNIERDDFLVTRTDSAVVRRVLSVRRSGDELVIETGHAYWHEVIRSGSYGMTIPFDRDAAATTLSGEKIPPQILPAITGGFGTTIGSLEKTFGRTDICAWADTIMDNTSGDYPKRLCHKEHDTEFEAGPLSIELAGTIDSLEILGGNVKAVGNLAINGTIDAGGISGGSPPVFSPCNRAAYLGCISTPTGAALIDWLRTYAPGIPDGSLPAVRLCLPGAPVRVKAGYWDYSGFLPKFIPPVFEACKITNNGTLPQVILPGFTAATVEVKPRISGKLTLFVLGDGHLGLDIGIPSLSISKKYAVTNDFKAEAKLGLFIGAEFGVKNAGGIFELTFDQEQTLTQTWTVANGWTGSNTRTVNKKSLQPLVLIRPDSITLKLAVKLKAEAELCIAIIACKEDDDLRAAVADQPIVPAPETANLFEIGVTVKGEASGEAFVEGTLTRELINQSPPVDDAKIAIEGGFGYELKAELKIPATGWILPKVPREFKKEGECCRTSLADLWLQGKLEVHTKTTGAQPDPNGYVVKVQRADQLPSIIKTGSQRANLPLDLGRPMTGDAAANDTVVFSRTGPCLVLYTDLFMPVVNPLFGSSVSGVDTDAEGVPSYAITFPCDLLIARYLVTLTDVSENCTVTGGAQKEVWLQSRDFLIQRQDTAYVDFDVVCNGTQPLGNLTITTKASTNVDHARDYDVSLAGVAMGTMGPNATRTITALVAGTRTLALTGGPTNCIGVDPIDVTIPSGGTATVNVNATCVAADTPPVPGQLTVITTTTGAGTDGDGYQVIIDGVPRAAVAANGGAEVNDFPASTPSVLTLANIAANCRPASALPLTFSFNATRAPVSIPLALSCVSTTIDTVVGAIESGATPGSLALRLESGAVFTITGPAKAELTQLAGMSLTVWGVKSGTSLDVFGWELAPSIADPRWTGIVTARAGGKLWLFGTEAIELVNAPASLAASVGAYVWVGGTREGDTGPVKPTVFGTIRSAP